ncbi:SAM-dependent methyltransferase [Nonomuraea aurantiaca]|uniref:SAM-dependent methyltransferase n=1 Tax=Nonomuraea aurantiaca TaxID=2878562 RepID=UPI001CD9F0E9|nr:SAM-dependent methyltransferase [Nonomuraea aurantiaca]MCA2223559.1 SAM-dependent methyltransferase [Nonomuraea aurantiaca]
MPSTPRRPEQTTADKIISIVPSVGPTTQANRAFLGKAVSLLAEEGVRQFVDIGAGLPTQDNVHQVAQRVAADARTAYIDNDPVVLVHARALLEDSPGTKVLDGDLRRPKELFADPALREHIDFDRPVAVLMLAVLHFIPDHDEVDAIVATVRGALVPGSYLLLSHFYTPDDEQATVRAGAKVYSATNSGSLTARSLTRINGYLAGLDLVAPGLVPVQAWRPDWEEDAVVDLSVPGLLGAVGRVPQ